MASWFSRYYNDDRVITQHYPGIKAFMESQIRQLDPSGILSFARYGDWDTIADGASTPPPFKRPDISTFYFIQGLRVASDFASQLGLNDDAERYTSLADATTQTYNTLWYNATNSVRAHAFGSTVHARAPSLTPSHLLD